MGIKNKQKCVFLILAKKERKNKMKDKLYWLTVEGYTNGLIELLVSGERLFLLIDELTRTQNADNLKISFRVHKEEK